MVPAICTWPALLIAPNAEAPNRYSWKFLSGQSTARHRSLILAACVHPTLDPPSRPRSWLTFCDPAPRAPITLARVRVFRALENGSGITLAIAVHYPVKRWGIYALRG